MGSSGSVDICEMVAKHEKIGMLVHKRRSTDDDLDAVEAILVLMSTSGAGGSQHDVSIDAAATFGPETSGRCTGAGRGMTATTCTWRASRTGTWCSSSRTPPSRRGSSDNALDHRSKLGQGDHIVYLHLDSRRLRVRARFRVRQDLGLEFLLGRARLWPVYLTVSICSLV